MGALESYLSDLTKYANNVTESVEFDRINRARKFARSGNYSNAENELIEPRFENAGLQKQAYLLLAKIYAQQGVYEKATHYWRKVLEVDQENFEATNGINAILKQNGISFISPMFKSIFSGIVLILGITILIFVINHNLNYFELRISQSKTSIIEDVTAHIQKVELDRSSINSKIITDIGKTATDLSEMKLDASKSNKKISEEITALNEMNVKNLMLVQSSLNNQIKDLNATIRNLSAYIKKNTETENISTDDW